MHSDHRQHRLRRAPGGMSWDEAIRRAVKFESRNLALWETEELLVKPMTMLLHCMESRGDSQQDRDALFTRICRLDPQAAFTVRR